MHTKVKTTIFSLPLLLLALLSLLYSCQPEKTKKYRIGVSQNQLHQWQQKQNNEIMNDAYLSNDTEVHFANAHGDYATQIQQIDSLVELGVNAIILVSNTRDKVTPAIERAYDKGVKVIIYDRKPTTPKYHTSLQVSNYNMGYTIGTHIASITPERGRVLEVLGPHNSPPSQLRHQGLVEALKQRPDVILDTIRGDWSEQSAYDAARIEMNKAAAANVIFGNNDLMAVGVRRALQDAGKLKTDTKFCGIDGLPGPDGGIRLVCDSILHATCMNPTMGDSLMNIAKSIIDGKRYTKDNTIESALITANNARMLYVINNETSDLQHHTSKLRSSVDNSHRILEGQRLYISMLAVFIFLMVIVCCYSIYAYNVKKKYSQHLKNSYEKQLQLTEEIEHLTNDQLTFYTHISHELRTPLTLIADPIDRLLEDETIQGTSRQLLETASSSMASLMTLVNEILEFRKMDEGKMHLSPTRFNLCTELHRWQGLVAEIMRRKRITISVDTSQVNDNCTIEADNEMLGHLFFNLMQIAMRYASAATHITLTLSPSTDGSHVSLIYTNSGVMINEEAVAKLFDRFKLTKGMAGGTAVSLANIKTITDLHHGTISARSLGDGKGMMMTITLPMHQDILPPHIEDEYLPTDNFTIEQAVKNYHESTSHNDTSPTTPLPKKPTDEQSDTTTILVVEDNDEVRDYIISILTPYHTVIACTNGSEGLDNARRHVPDIIISDVMMPVMDGLEMCHSLKNDPITSHIPIILLTARSLDHQHAEGLFSGAYAYLKKPFSSRVLLAQIDSVLRNRHLMQVRWDEATHLAPIPQAPLTVGDISATPTPAAAQGMSAIGTPAALVLQGSAPAASSAPAGGSLSPQDSEFLQKLQNTIDRLLSDSSLSVEQIGEVMSMSRVQLYRKTKALTGLSPVEMLRKARLSRARILLQENKSTISEVAYRVGFSTPSYFSKCYKDEYGILPNEQLTIHN